ncbi:MAG: helix-turn-helix domain-containing protein [Lysobacteraceae bacterium]
MTPDEIELASSAHQRIARCLDQVRAVTIRVTADNGNLPPVEVPVAALPFIGEMLGAMSQGKAVTVMSYDREMTTAEAARFLNVSRQFVIREMEAGRIPFRQTGAHRLADFEDLVRYRRQIAARQMGALEQLADDAQELGLDT